MQMREPGQTKTFSRDAANVKKRPRRTTPRTVGIINGHAILKYRDQSSPVCVFQMLNLLISKKDVILFKSSKKKKNKTTNEQQNNKQHT